MPSCEKCWRESADPWEHAAKYDALLKERDAEGKACTPEEQAGPKATECAACKRMTVHQYARICVLCGASQDKERGAKE